MSRLVGTFRSVWTDPQRQQLLGRADRIYGSQVQTKGGVTVRPTMQQGRGVERSQLHSFALQRSINTYCFSISVSAPLQLTISARGYYLRQIRRYGLG